MPKENFASRAMSIGHSPNIRGSENRHGRNRRRFNEAVKVDASVKRARSNEPVEHTVIESPSAPISNFPTTEADIPLSTLKKSVITFVDSVLSLCMKSATSCSESGFMESAFIGLVKECGFAEAKCWAESLGIPHEHSARLLSALMLGSHREFRQSTLQSSKRDPSNPLPSRASRGANDACGRSCSRRSVELKRTRDSPTSLKTHSLAA